ncbi:hypothetical protein [Planifilum fimeticola]|nr:hypothetical protein [Planifilum fimeticola]
MNPLEKQVPEGVLSSGLLRRFFPWTGRRGIVPLEQAMIDQYPF